MMKLEQIKQINTSSALENIRMTAYFFAGNKVAIKKNILAFQPYFHVMCIPS